jgi:hypothetical protein
MVQKIKNSRKWDGKETENNEPRKKIELQHKK